MNANHPDWQQILDTLEGMEGTGATGTREHIDACERCRTLAGRLQELLDELALARGTRPPAALVERAVQAVLNEADPWAPIRAIFRRGLEIVRATHVPVLAPVRGGATSQMLRFDAPSHTITLSVSADTSASSGRVKVRGQLVPRTSTALPAGARAILVGGGEHAESVLTSFGEFSFAGVARERMHLAIEVGGERLEMGPFGETTA